MNPRDGLQAIDLKVELDAEAGVVRALDGIRLSIERGETFALVGESGCGKSMTALALLRLLPENGRIADGQVRLGDLDVLGLPESAMRSVRGARIGMIFQEPSTSLNPVMRIGDQIVEAIETHTVLRGAAARVKAIEWLGRVGIPEPERRIDEYPFRLSGGQKQRVMIAMTLAAEPDFLVADEPTTALDVTIQAQILDLLRTLQREQQMGLLLITHDLAVVASIAQRVALMYAGQIIEVAPADKFFAAPKHPYARALLRALPDAGRRGQPLQAIAGTVPPLWSVFEGCRFAPRCSLALPSCTTHAPQLFDAGAQRQVRCLLHAPGAGEQRFTVEREATAVADNPGEARQAATPLLQVQGLSVSFPIRSGLLQRASGAFQAVRDVSFKVARGRTLALVGESGCGKTTTGKAIVQLLRGQARIEGQALLEGRNLFELQGDALLAARRDVQIIFQDPFASLNPRMRVFELLEEGLQALHPQLSAQQRRQRIEGLSERVGLGSGALERFPHEFSGGQRQRIAIARALAVQPKLVVCDEPTSALDVSVQAQLLNLLRELQRDMVLSYLFITHIFGVVELVEEGLQALHPQLSAQQRRQRIEGLSERVGLGSSALERFPHEFSGGQRQRIAIARALAVQPKLVVCDEPTSALDVSVQAQILNLLRELQRDIGLSYLFITHNIGVVEYIADEVAVMRAGAIVEQGHCAAVLGSPGHEYTRELLAAVPRLAQRG
jgi:peptide/nickel transport system ATP-binding protein